MKTVKLTNGRRAIPVRIEFLLDRDDLAAILAYVYVGDWSEEAGDWNDGVPPKVTKAKFRELIVDTLQHNTSYPYWADYIGDRTQEAIEKWALAEVDRLTDNALVT